MPNTVFTVILLGGLRNAATILVSVQEIILASLVAAVLLLRPAVTLVVLTEVPDPAA